MNRKEFLEKARQLACQQISESSCLPEQEFKAIMESDDTEEVAYYRKAMEILQEASTDMIELTFPEMVEFAR